MTVRQWLSRAWKISEDIKALEKARSIAYERAISITGNPDAVVVSGTKEPNKFDGYAILCATIEEQEDKLNRIKAEIIGAIYQMPTQRFRDVLMKRHVDCLKYEECAVELGYSYKQTKRNYSRALQEIEPIVMNIMHDGKVTKRDD